MDRKKLNEILNKHVQKFFKQNPMARFDDINNDVFIDAMEEAINYSRCCMGEAEQLCDHPRSERSYIGQNMLRCNKCGKEFS